MQNNVIDFHRECIRRACEKFDIPFQYGLDYYKISKEFGGDASALRLAQDMIKIYAELLKLNASR